MNEVGTPPNDPKTGKPLRGEDRRAEFERISRETPHDPEAARAFIESKIEIVLADSRLSESEKKRAVAELRARLR